MQKLPFVRYLINGRLYICNNVWLSPEWFHLPSFRESHGSEVNLRVINEEPTEFGKHIVVWRNDVEEILDDTNREVNTQTICW